MPRQRTPPPILGETPTMTRDEARIEMRTLYFTGQLCVQGHLDWRWTSGGQCRSCQNPPPKVTRYQGLNPLGYKYTFTPRLKMLVLPENEDQMRSLIAILENAAREWAYSWGLAVKPKDDG